VISNVFIGNTNNYYYTTQYDPYYYGAPYNPVYYDDYYDSGYYAPEYYSPQYSYIYEPFYYAFPFSYGYYPSSYAYSPSYYGGYPDYGYTYTDDFPLPYYPNSYLGNGFVSQLFSDLLAYGYQQGYEDGLYARSHRRYRAYYDDPYAFDDTVYDPYSYSLGENRRCLSRGYELGYQDALSGYDEYDPYYSDNGGNLVSMLIGNALQFN